MQRPGDAARTVPLVLELANGTARLHGEELELPLREFRLLAALAARVGEVVPSDALIKAVWPDAPWTSSNDLYTLVSKLRRLIDGPDKFGNNIRNRRGFGYVLDLEPDQLVVIDPAPVGPTPLTVDPTEKGSPPPPEPALAAPVADGQEPSPIAVARRNPLRTAPGWALLVAVLLAGSWGVGYVLSSRNSSQKEAKTAQEQAPDVTQAEAPKKTEPSDRRGSDRRRPNRRKDGKKQSRTGRTGRTGNSGPAAGAAPPRSADTPTTNTATKGSRKGSENKEPAPAPLPPAPTRYLYHLVNEQSGDHFVTTDGNTASEYEARGYEGGAIGRVYNYQEEGTRAIVTNAGTGYVFIRSTPKTEPASRTLALWYSTNNNGDFFYTTSESAAKQDGWSASLIGYVRSL